jgi:hypothetical protein
MVQNVTVTSQQQGMPGFYQIIVKADVIPPFGGSMMGTPQATLTSGAGQMGPIGMQQDPAVQNRWMAFFGGPAGNYTGGVTVDWQIMSQKSESGTSAATTVP